MDRTDRSILEELNADARRSHRQIAVHRNLAPTTVSHRISRLEKQGIIQGYVPLLNDEALGWDLVALISIRISRGRLREVEEELAQDGRAYAIYDVTGEYDALLIGRFRDRHDLDKFVKHMLHNPYVERTNTQVVLNRVKEDRRVPLPPTKGVKENG